MHDQIAVVNALIISYSLNQPYHVLSIPKPFYISPMKFLFTLLLFSTSLVCVAGGENETQGARANALGGASVALSDVWSASNNPGALALMNRYAVGMAYGTRFFLPEAGMKTLNAALPLGGNVFGIAAHSYGYSGYSNNRIGLSASRKLSDIICLGVQLNVVQFKMGDVYGQRSALVGEVGMLIKPNDRWRFGAHVYNPNRSKLADFDNERIPSTLRIGTQYLFSKKVSAVAELDKSILLPINLKTGIEYSPTEPLFLRAGFATAQSAFSFGFGLVKKSLKVDVSATWNQRLGYSSAVGLSIEFGKPSK